MKTFTFFSADALERNEEMEFERNVERFRFLKVNIQNTGTMVVRW